jgi:hypothetical protein
MGPRRGTAPLAASLLFLGALVSADAHAEPPPPDAMRAARAEARTRFDLGLKLFGDGDNAGALAEFERAYRLIPNPLVRFNIGLVYAAMGRPVDAVAALDEVLAAPGSMKADKLARAKEIRAQQAARIARLSVTTNVPAALELDGVAAGRTPLAAPLQASAGIHVIGAVATGYVALRREVTAAGGTTEEVALSLVPMERILAHATVRCRLPGASVFVDDHPAGTTPLAESLTLSPGPHVIEVRRDGYRPARREVSLGEGATAEVELSLEEDPVAVAESGGTVELDIREPNAQVVVDGVPRGLYTGALRLASGEHRFVVECGGFEPASVGVTVAAHQTRTVRVVLDPTPETRAAYEHRRAWHHQTGLLVGGGGVALIGASIPFIVWNAGRVRSLTGPYNAAQAALVNSTAPNCDFAAGPPNSPATCNQVRNNAYSALQSAQDLTPVGYVGLGLGIAATVTGAVLYFTAGRADRFPAHAASTQARLTWSVTPWGGPHEGGLWTAAAF